MFAGAALRRPGANLSVWKVTAAGNAKPAESQRRFIGEAEIDGLSGMTCAVPSPNVKPATDRTLRVEKAKRRSVDNRLRATDNEPRLI